MHNGKTSAMCQEAAHTNYQQSSPSCETRAIQKQTKNNNNCIQRKMLENFPEKEKNQKNIPLEEKWQCRKGKRTKMQKNETGELVNTKHNQVLLRNIEIIL